ncbi:hypothetical protein H4P12_09575 [Paracoccus sp. 11-3]|uniref:Uncharacterized protein n=1 Tax=Paracoccus amoyensis TaxID=2760093 RepID=A0A926GD62_9RHOB|nr:DUF6173 family protein [Paracoccus amoyensis]MBC9246960.1 hypothetical protein [Paracoccus amoyensis]
MTKKPKATKPKTPAKTDPEKAELPAIANNTAICAEAEQAAMLHAAEEVFNHILGRVKQFQAEMPDEHELGLQLPDLGGGHALHVRGMGFKNPNIIEFYGMLDGERQVAIIQHISQLNFMMIAVPPPADQKPYRIGFGAEL